jgi:hypothetical protein
MPPHPLHAPPTGQDHPPPPAPPPLCVVVPPRPPHTPSAGRAHPSLPPCDIVSPCPMIELLVLHHHRVRACPCCLELLPNTWTSLRSCCHVSPRDDQSKDGEIRENTEESRPGPLPLFSTLLFGDCWRRSSSTPSPFLRLWGGIQGLLDTTLAMLRGWGVHHLVSVKKNSPEVTTLTSRCSNENPLTDTDCRREVEKI